MKKFSLFKRFWNLEGKLGGVYTGWYPPSALNPSRWVLYSIFMQSWVLWEEPELAVDSERSWSSGNRDPVDAICPIIFISFGQRWVPPRLRTQTKTTLPIKYKYLCLTLFLNFDLSGDGNQTGFWVHWCTSFYWEHYLRSSTVLKNLSNDSEHILTRQRQKVLQRDCLSVFYSWLNSSKPCLHSTHSKNRQLKPLEELFFTGLCGMHVRPSPLRPTSWLAGWHSCLAL